MSNNEDAHGHGASEGRPLLRALTDFLESDDWDYHQLEEHPFLYLNFAGKNGSWRCLIHADDEHAQLVVYSLGPLEAPRDQRARMMEFVTRANYGLMIGNFELDVDDGQVRFKTSLDASDGTPSFAALKRLLHTNVLTMDRYLPGVEAVLEGDATPEAAINAVES